MTAITFYFVENSIIRAYHKLRPKTALPLAFTEHGVTMLANVLKSKKARQTNVAIVRAFIALKQFILSHKEIVNKLEELKINMEVV